MCSVDVNEKAMKMNNKSEKCICWIEIKKQGTTLKISIAYHPRSNGQTKVLNITMERYLRCVQSNPNLGLSLSRGQNSGIIHITRELPGVPHLK